MRTLRYLGVNKEFVVNKIFCLGRNYSEHAREMGAELPTAPVIFMKPSSAVIRNGDIITIPKISDDVHHEVELVVAIGKEGKNIPAVEAYEYVAGYAVGLDMTLRDVQSEAKKKGLPWTVAKGFDTSAPVSDIVPTADIPDPHNLMITCKVNGTLRQKGNTADMIFSIDKIIEYLSSVFTIEAGDLIYTGTPEGVGRVKKGDIIEAELVGFLKLSNPVTSA